MQVKYNVTGPKRKELVKVVSEAIGTKAKYLGMPSAAYEAGPYRILKDGTLEYDDSTEAASVLESIATAGFECEPQDRAENGTVEVTEGPLDTAQGESTGLTVEVPFDKVNVGNLTKLLDAKGALIKKALGAEDIRIEMKEDRVAFPWFQDPDADHAAAYTKFIAALCRMSREAKRVTAKEKEVSNEKYAFRCFLLRLGFIGAEYKKDRKILLENLTGSSAFRNGGAGHAVSE